MSKRRFSNDVLFADRDPPRIASIEQHILRQAIFIFHLFDRKLIKFVGNLLVLMIGQRYKFGDALFRIGDKFVERRDLFVERLRANDGNLFLSGFQDRQPALSHGWRTASDYLS